MGPRIERLDPPPEGAIALRPATRRSLPLNLLASRLRTQYPESIRSSPPCTSRPMPATITVICPECDKEMKAPAEAEGKKIKCKGCGKTFVAMVEIDEI